MEQLVSELEKVTGFSGTSLTVYLITSLVVGILLIVAMWKIFTKAGYAGWKSLIPIYDAYILCKIIKINFWLWIIIIPVVLGFVSGLLLTDLNWLSQLITGVYLIIIDIVTSRRLAKAFGKGTGFTVGLILLPNLFQLILGFGSSKYVGIKD